MPGVPVGPEEMMRSLPDLSMYIERGLCTFSQEPVLPGPRSVSLWVHRKKALTRPRWATA